MAEGRAHHRKESVVKTPSDYEIVFQLAKSQASDPSIIFPPGCPVCFNHNNNSASKYNACEGVVTSVSMGRDPSKPMSTSMIIIYDVESSDGQGGKSTSRFLQDSLAYAYGCPVYLTRDNDEKIEAEIAFSHSVADPEKGRSHIVYMVVSRQGGMITTEKGVKPTRVRYRRLEKNVEPSQGENVEENNVEDVAVKRDKQLLEHPSGVSNSMTNMQVPQEITSNQMDSLSETLTEIAESSQVKVVEINDEEANIPIKEEPKPDVTPHSTIEDATETKQTETEKEKSCITAVSDENSKPNSFQKENTPPASTETPNVANKLSVATNKTLSRQEVSQLPFDANLDDDKINARNLSAKSLKTNKMPMMNEKEQSTVFTNERWKPPKQSPGNSPTTALDTSTSVTDDKTQRVSTTDKHCIREIKIPLPLWLYRKGSESAKLFGEFKSELVGHLTSWSCVIRCLND